MSGWLAVVAFVATAPIDTPPSIVARMSARRRRVRSTSAAGRSTSSFMRSRRFVPPARNFAWRFAATARTAVSGSLARTYSNGLIRALPLPLPLLSYAGQLPLVGEPPRPRRPSARLDLLNGGDDPWVRAAAADVAAHAFADLVVGELCRPL